MISFFQWYRAQVDESQALLESLTSRKEEYLSSPLALWSALERIEEIHTRLEPKNRFLSYQFDMLLLEMRKKKK